jgi:hypothetical protein
MTPKELQFSQIDIESNVLDPVELESAAPVLSDWAAVDPDRLNGALAAE